MGRAVLMAIIVFALMLQSSFVFGSSGQVMKVVDGDTFMMEVAGVRGPEMIEVNLRCSDAPIVGAPFGEESKQYLETLLKGAEIHFKVQAYCGSETCVEVLAYIPDPANPQINYINTQMIAAGMARNDSCRGVFITAETKAKAEKTGIWSTTKKIVFADAEKRAQPGSTKVAKKPTTSALNPRTAPALIEVDRAERTVTLKSKGLSLSKSIKAIDTVSTLPVNLYLIEEQYIPLALEKVSWYAALQHIVEKANLKQVNMNGKIDLYDQLFYYKHIAPHLKLSDNDGVYIKAGSGSKSQVVDDGVTRYVFVNDFENSAEESRQKSESQSGFVQVHQGDTPAPVSNYGRFEVSEEKEKPVVVATTEAVVTTPSPVERPPLKPYSGKRVAADKEQKESTAAIVVPVVVPVEITPDPGPVATEKMVESQESGSSQAEPNKVKESPQNKSITNKTPAVKTTESEPVLNIALNSTELISLLVAVVVVVLGSVFLSRSAAKRAAKAERSIDPDALGKMDAADFSTPEPLVDKDYEKEIFEDITQSSSETVPEEDVDAIFQDSPEPQVEQSTEETVTPEEEPVEESVDDQVEEPESREESLAEEKPEITEQLKEEVQTEDTVKANDIEEPKTEQIKPTQKTTKGLVTDEGNYAVTLDDYDRLMNPPKREPRSDCLFEVTCSLGDQTTTGIGLDISSGGIFIDSKEPFGVGKVLDLTFKLQEEDKESIHCRGAVTWVNKRPDPIKPNYPNGFGIHFLDVDTATANKIIGFLKPDDLEQSIGAEDDLE